MATVCIWNGVGLTGHVSLGTAHDYFSFHPDNEDLIKDVMGSPAELRTYESDCERNGMPKHRIKIDWLDEDAMVQRMGEIDVGARHGRIKYRLLSTNCSSMAADLLFAGAGVNFDSHKTMKQLYSELNRRPFRHDHMRALEWVREAIEDVAFMCARRGRVAPVAKTIVAILLATDLASREFCWSPGDVKILAEGLARQNHLH